MEYEIGDDPQGLPDHPDGDRDGGLLETRDRRHRVFFPRDLPDDALEEDTPIQQFGELV